MADHVSEPWRAAVTVHLRVRVASERQGEFRAFLAEAIPFYESPGGIRVSLLSDGDEADRFIEVVEYVDARAHLHDDERVRTDPVMGEFLSRWRSLLVEPPVVETYFHVEIPQ